LTPELTAKIKEYLLMSQGEDIKIVGDSLTLEIMDDHIGLYGNFEIKRKKLYVDGDFAVMADFFGNLFDSRVG
jgi:lipopolysaccharide assembly outer membrane protein LptD (OstA)